MSGLWRGPYMTDNVLSCVFFYPGLFSLCWQCVWDLCHATKLSFFSSLVGQNLRILFCVDNWINFNKKCSSKPRHGFHRSFTDGCRVITCLLTSSVDTDYDFDSSLHSLPGEWLLDSCPMHLLYHISPASGLIRCWIHVYDF